MTPIEYDLHTAHAGTFPTIHPEALACGTPGVAAVVGGIPEQIEEGVTGYLTPPDADAMAGWVVELLEAEDKRNKQLKMRIKNLMWRNMP